MKTLLHRQDYSHLKIFNDHVPNFIISYTLIFYLEVKTKIQDECSIVLPKS